MGRAEAAGTYSHEAAASDDDENENERSIPPGACRAAALNATAAVSICVLVLAVRKVWKVVRTRDGSWTRAAETRSYSASADERYYFSSEPYPHDTTSLKPGTLTYLVHFTLIRIIAVGRYDETAAPTRPRRFHRGFDRPFQRPNTRRRSFSRRTHRLSARPHRQSRLARRDRRSRRLPRDDDPTRLSRVRHRLERDASSPRTPARPTPSQRAPRPCTADTRMRV